MAAKKPTRSKLIDTNHRVYRVSEFLRSEVKAARERKSLTVKAFVEEALAELPKIAEGLKALGIEPAKKDARPARLPMSDEALAKLKKGAEATGVPQSALLMACLALASRRKRRARR